MKGGQRRAGQNWRWISPTNAAALPSCEQRIPAPGVRHYSPRCQCRRGGHHHYRYRVLAYVRFGETTITIVIMTSNPHRARRLSKWKIIVKKKTMMRPTEPPEIHSHTGHSALQEERRGDRYAENLLLPCPPHHLVPAGDCASAGLSQNHLYSGWRSRVEQLREMASKANTRHRAKSTRTFSLTPSMRFHPRSA